MSRLLLFAIIALFSFCSPGTETPEGVLEKEKMTGVLLDINLAEGALKARYILGDSASYAAAGMYEAIWYKHRVTREEFNRSLEFYLHHPKIMDKMYEEIITSLSKQESGITD